MAFVELIAKYPTKPIYLFCVCDKGEKGGWDLFGIFKRELQLRKVSIEQFADRLMISSVDMKFRDEDINMFYNVANIGINTADGEGWGLCNFEQMGVGVPQVVPDIGGFKEFANSSNSMIVKPTVRYYLPMVYCPVGGEALACDPHDMCLAIEEYITNSSKLEEHGKAARETVLKYTWPSCLSNLVKRLEVEKKEIDEEKNTDN
jgi:glycosyltransferase involved in cell wall biosynthesis